MGLVSLLRVFPYQLSKFPFWTELFKFLSLLFWWFCLITYQLTSTLKKKKSRDALFPSLSLKRGLPIQTRLYARPGIHLPLPPSVGNKDVHCCTCLQSSPVSPVISCPFRPQPRVSCLPFLTGHQGGCGAGVLYRLLRWVIRPSLFYAFCADLSCSFLSCRY